MKIYTAASTLTLLLAVMCPDTTLGAPIGTRELLPCPQYSRRQLIVPFVGGPGPVIDDDNPVFDTIDTNSAAQDDTDSQLCPRDDSQPEEEDDGQDTLFQDQLSEAKDENQQQDSSNLENPNVFDTWVKRS